MRKGGCRGMVSSGGVRSLAIMVAASILLVWMGGCITKTPPKTAELPPPEQPKLVLQAGDKVLVQFLYWPELTLDQTVRLDGKINLLMVGDVQATGRTPEELRDTLKGMFADKIKDPEINVVVETLGNQRVYVGGEVRIPGIIMMTGKMTLIQAIMQAGGFDKTSAKLSDVVLIRQKDGKQYAKSFDVRKMLADPNSDTVELGPFDVIYVPRTAIDKVDQWVDQYINKIVPRNFYANYVWDDQRDAITDPQTSSVNVQLPGL